MAGPAPLGVGSWQHRLCSRLLGHTDSGDEITCRASAARHIIHRWDEVPEGGNPDDHWDQGFACPEHWREFQEHWSCAASHSVDSACGMPGSLYVHEEGRCVFDELETAEPLRAIAEPYEYARSN